MGASSQRVEEYYFKRKIVQESKPSSLTRDYYWWKLRRNIAGALKKHVNASGLVVDVGAGHGITTSLAYRCLGPDFQYLATDLNELDLSIAAAVFQAQNLRVSTRVGDSSTRLPLLDGEAAVVVCAEVLEHIPRPETLLSEVRRILRPGGIAVFTTPNPANLLVRLWKRGQDRPETTPETTPAAGHGHVSVLGSREWKKRFRKTGFRVIEIRRGALLFGRGRYETSPLVVGLYILTDALLDWLPGARTLSENLCYVLTTS